MNKTVEVKAAPVAAGAQRLKSTEIMKIACGVWKINEPTEAFVTQILQFARDIESFLAARATQATPAPMPVERDVFYELVERFGDAVTDMFDQMDRGNWVDDHGHDVRMNAQMRALIPIVVDAIAARATPNN